jgi:hypothetical protein
MVLGFFYAMGQEADTMEVDMPEEGFLTQFIKRQENMGLFIGYRHLVQTSSDLKNNEFDANVVGGILWNRWIVNISYVRYADQNTSYLIFPNLSSYDYEQVSIGIGYELIQTARSAFGLQARIGQGKTEWKRVEDDLMLFRSRYPVLTAEFEYMYQPLRFLQVGLVTGYRWLGDVKVPGIESSDISGLFFGVGTRLGLFKRGEE